jgi:muconolactone delta-isomerase
MDYLVDMTTHVPEGTPQETVDDIRAREAARARELIFEGHLKRLWRPPLAPKEWRTFGLFSADDDGQLDKILTSMPLHVWRTDTVTPLSPHPNDPGGAGGGEPIEFLTTLTLTVPEGTARETVDDMKAREPSALMNWPWMDVLSASGRHRTNPASGGHWGSGAPATRQTSQRRWKPCRCTSG